jgi:hypothetical protein
MQLVIYNDAIKDNHILLDSFNGICIMRCESDYPTISELLNSLKNIKSITHIALVYYFTGSYTVPLYYDTHTNIIEPAETQSKYIYFSNNLLSLFSTIRKEVENLTVDILTCSINSLECTKEIFSIEKSLDITIRHSTQHHKNVDVGLLNSKSIQNTYFDTSTNTTNQDYQIPNNDMRNNIILNSQNGQNGYKNITYGNKIFTLNNHTTWLVTEFISLKNGEIFDGNGYDITIVDNGSVSANKFCGLFTTLNDSSITIAPTVMNLVVVGRGLQHYAGYIVQDYQKYFIVRDCNTHGLISGTSSGGIAGRLLGGNLGRCVIYNCHSTGNITGLMAGGIVGSKIANNMGVCVVYNCYSTGNITGDFSAGIVSDNAGSIFSNSDDIVAGNCSIYNCYSTGNIVGVNSGGIVGPYSGHCGTCIVYNTYSTGNISGAGSGGICASYAGYDGRVTIYNSYSTGSINGYNSGGITGKNAAHDGKCVIFNCYSSGNISDAGGIVGTSSGKNGICIIYNCYTSGNFLNENSGGICAKYAGLDGCLLVAYCYSNGTVLGNDYQIYNGTVPVHGNKHVSTLLEGVGDLNTSTSYSTGKSPKLQWTNMFANFHYTNTSNYTINITVPTRSPFVTTDNYPVLYYQLFCAKINIDDGNRLMYGIPQKLALSIERLDNNNSPTIKYKYERLDNNVVKVSNNGDITPISIGTTIVTVTAINRLYITTCAIPIIVNRADVFLLPPPEKTVTFLSTPSTITITPATCNISDTRLLINYSSSDNDIAEFETSNNMITIKRDGDITVTASVANNNNYNDNSISWPLSLQHYTTDMNNLVSPDILTDITYNSKINTNMRHTPSPPHTPQNTFRLVKHASSFGVGKIDTPGNNDTNPEILFENTECTINIRNVNAPCIISSIIDTPEIVCATLGTNNNPDISPYRSLNPIDTISCDDTSQNTNVLDSPIICSSENSGPGSYIASPRIPLLSISDTYDDPGTNIKLTPRKRPSRPLNIVNSGYISEITEDAAAVERNTMRLTLCEKDRRISSIIPLPDTGSDYILPPKPNFITHFSNLTSNFTTNAITHIPRPQFQIVPYRANISVTDFISKTLNRFENISSETINTYKTTIVNFITRVFSIFSYKNMPNNKKID